MQITGVTPMAARTDVPTAPATRPEAAQALAAMPAGIAGMAAFVAMSKQMAGETASRADLVAPMLEQMTPEQARMTMLNAIDGALALAPELADRNEALRQAAAGIEALLVEVAADTTQTDVDTALQGLMTPLEPLMTPFMEAALVLDPNFGQEPGEG